MIKDITKRKEKKINLAENNILSMRFVMNESNIFSLGRKSKYAPKIKKINILKNTVVKDTNQNYFL